MMIVSSVKRFSESETCAMNIEDKKGRKYVKME